MRLQKKMSNSFRFRHAPLFHSNVVRSETPQKGRKTRDNGRLKSCDVSWQCQDATAAGAGSSPCAKADDRSRVRSAGYEVGVVEEATKGAQIAILGGVQPRRVCVCVPKYFQTLIDQHCFGFSLAVFCDKFLCTPWC